MTRHDASPQAPRTAADTALAEAASHWDARLRAPACGEADRAAFAAWRDADPAHRTEFERLQAILAALHGGRDQLALRRLREDALAQAARHGRRRSLAALVAGVVVLAVTLAWRVAPDGLRDEVAAKWSARLLAPEGSVQHYRTGIGQRSTVSLADGSTVDLNAMTRLDVVFDRDRRSVRLHEGQAIFHVARQPSRPFVVQAGGRKIVAVGTAFDVRVDAASLRVTLIEGKVGVLSAQAVVQARRRGDGHPPDPARRDGPVDEARGPADRVYLVAGEQFIAGLVRQPSEYARPALVRPVDVGKIIGWREGQLFFEDQSLADAVAEMNKYSAVQIELVDPALAALRVNGMFHTGQQHAFARAVEDYFHVVATTEGERRILLRRR